MSSMPENSNDDRMPRPSATKETSSKSSNWFSEVSSWRNWFEVNPESLELIKSLPDDSNETGADRLREVWTAFQSGETSVEMKILTNAMSTAGIMGFIFGGIVRSQNEIPQMIRRLNTNVYEGKYRANRDLSDKIYLQFFRNGSRQAVKFFFFSGLFVGPLIASATYRNDIRFLDCAACGSATGILYRGHLGPRAAAVNAVVGAIFGLTFASLMKLALKMSNSSIREMRYYHKAIKDDSGL